MKYSHMQAPHRHALYSKEVRCEVRCARERLIGAVAAVRLRPYTASMACLCEAKSLYHI